MCIVLYMKLIWCNGFAEIYAQLEEGVESICHGYMCIVLYMQLIWCNGFPDIYAQLEEGWWGQSVMKLILCSGLPCISGRLEGVVLPADLPSLVQWYSWHLCSSERGQSVIHPCYTITPPCQLTIDPCYTITPFPLPIDHRSMLHHYTPQLCPRYLCIMLYVKLMWCSGLPWTYSQLEEGVGSVCHESDSM